uniref:Peptidase M12B domain-containing protein n=1 Tax=Ditylenchus dipsaci TaxID=166011 RepID=A0A915D6J6_9BILA
MTPYLQKPESTCRVFTRILWSTILLLSVLAVSCQSDSYSLHLDDHNSNESSAPSDSYFSKFIRKRSVGDPSDAVKKNRCELKLVADYEFFQVIGNGNYANAARYLVNMIERINGIFTAVDWGLDINGKRLVNLGFSIKEIKIFDRPTSSSPFHFNSLVSTHEDGSFYAFEVLKSFSEEEGTNSTCLSMLVSAKVFDQGILGVANIGEKDFELVISVRRKSELMITRVVDLVAAHELGHAWGAIHDEIEDDCIAPNSQGNPSFVMHESSNTGYDKNNYFFSPCSVRSIHKVLYGLAHQCFVEEKSALCGNGILEAGEECDSGHLSADNASDLCCTSECRLHARTPCQPKSSETCKKAVFCSGNSSLCPEPEPIENGADCVDEGKCFDGDCVSFCENISKNLSPCICENITESCKRCCRSLDSGLCAPVTPIRWLSDGSICIQGQCHNKVCEKKVTDEASLLWKIFRNFKETPDHKFFADYFVFIIVFVSLLIWCPCGAFIVYNDRRKHTDAVRNSSEDVIHIVPAKRVFHEQ